MKFLEALIYGFVSGITEFLPISSGAHQQFLESIFNAETTDPVRNLFVHLAILFAVYTGTVQARNRYARARRTRRGTTASKIVKEYQLLRNAAVPFLIVFFLLRYIMPLKSNLLLVSLFLLINGILIFLPERMLQGNKNAVVMSKFDSLLIGVIGALSAFPGFSRIGGMISAATLRGAERKSAANWALLLSIPALFALIFIDILSIFSGNGGAFWSNFLYHIVSAILAFIGTRLGIYILRHHIRKNGCSGYAYYCWGAALFALILFLTIG